MPRGLEEIFNIEMKNNGFTLLTVTLPHVYALKALPLHHNDPFDRLLIAQARAEGLTAVTRDGEFEKYEVDLLW